ncbi:MAG: methionyl-tRNA formyltransferase [Hyphomicrobiaceae bacterium]
MALRTAFMGTPDFAVPTLRALLDAGHEVVAVYSQPPRPAGRGMAERPSPVHGLASTRGIPVRTPRSLRNAEAQQDFAALGADVAVVVAYGLILPRPILEAPRHGCLNLHPSRLPRWRGAAPIQRTIMAGDRETAIAVMRMDEGLDTGPVCLEVPVELGPDMTAGELHDLAASEGAALMVAALARLEAGTLACRPQAEEGVTYAAKIDKAEARIDWARPAAAVNDLIRGLSPFPGAFLEIAGPKGPERVKVLAARIADGAVPIGALPGTVLDDVMTIACGDGGAIRPLLVQRAGKKPMETAEFLRGHALGAGTRLA